MRSTRLQQVGEESAENFTLIGNEPEPPLPVAAKKDTAAMESRLSGLIVTALKTLSQRSLVAISNLFTLLLAGSAFVLWRSVLPSPSVLQLVGLGGYAGFVLALEFVRRR
jgi:hypothetical protein